MTEEESKYVLSYAIAIQVKVRRSGVLGLVEEYVLSHLLLNNHLPSGRR